MPNLDLPILVVDDAKFSSTIISKTLSKAGYRDIRIANNAQTGLQMLEQRPVSLLVADWLMPEMDGLELAARVRQLDEATNHFTYIILLTAKESLEAISEAFDRGVDDFVFKSEMNRQLLPRVYAADRITDMQNSMLVANQLLVENNRELENKNVIDLITGIGNHRYASTQLAGMLKHASSRGGAVSYLLLGVKNWQSIKQQHSPAVTDEIAVGISRRLRHLTRPLDSIARLSENQFVVIGHFKDIEHCTTSCYRRIHDGVALKAFKTTGGFISLDIGTSVVAIDGRHEAAKAPLVEKIAIRKLQHAYETARITVTHWEDAQKELESDD